MLRYFYRTVGRIEQTEPFYVIYKSSSRLTGVNSDSALILP